MQMPILVRLIHKLQAYFEYRVEIAGNPGTLIIRDALDGKDLATYSVVDLLDDYRTLPIETALNEITEFVTGDIEEKISKKSYDHIS